MNTALITPVVQTPARVELDTHRTTRDWSDRIALGITRSLRFLADTFFAKRYGNRAIVLETVAAVPGLVGAALIHLRCLRWMKHDQGWIRALMEEAENERMHLMTFIEIAQPNMLERLLIVLVQGAFFNPLLPALSPLAKDGASRCGLFRGSGRDQLYAASR